MNAIIIFVPNNKGDFPNHPESVIGPFNSEDDAQEWIDKNRPELNKKYPGALGWSYSINDLIVPLKV